MKCSEFTLSHPQKRVWYIEKMYPSQSLYNIGGTIRIKGSINFKLLEQAINMFIQDHDGIRLKFIEKEGAVYQYVEDFNIININFIDFSQLKQPYKKYEVWLKDEVQKPFKLIDAPLFYFVMFKISENDNGYLVKLHHLIADGWSSSLLTKQISQNYIDLLENNVFSDRMSSSYTDFLKNEEEYLNSERYQRNKNFWIEKFQILPEKFLFSTSDDIRGDRINYSLNNEISKKVKQITSKYKVSLNTFFTSLLLLYLNKQYCIDDLVVGIPVFNRINKYEKQMFGMFTNNVPLRICIDKDYEFSTFLSYVNRSLLKCYINQKYPYEELVKILELRKKGFSALFDIFINYYNTDHHNIIDNKPVENEDFYCGSQIYSLQLIVKEWSDSNNISLSFDFKVADYSPYQIQLICKFFKNTINMISYDNQILISEIELLSEIEKNKYLYHFNNSFKKYPDLNFIQLFKKTVDKYPENIALSFDKEKLTYIELDMKSNSIASYLLSKGIGKDSVICVYFSHSIELIVSILGILKTGACYLPIDVNYPKNRIEFILQDANVAMILTNIKDSVFKDIEVINMFDNHLFNNYKEKDIEIDIQPDNDAYIIYTSGSTGKPKGVVISHFSLFNYIYWAKNIYEIIPEDVFGLFTSIGFDLTITSIFVPLISGAKIRIYDSKLDDKEYVLYKIIRENQVTILKMTPSHLSLIKDRNNSHLKIKSLILGGEKLTQNLSAKIYKSFNSVNIYNEYGPTEATVGCMIYKYNPLVDDNRNIIPIGVPADNVQIYILDENLYPKAKGYEGEIYISGNGLAKGYLNNPELTNSKFIKNPFIKDQKMYKTGDLAVYLEDGIIEYKGRFDNQVKIHGYRIELSEIEKQLLQIKKIQDALVIVQNDKLCAYLVVSEVVDEIKLKARLLKNIPYYMVPQYYIIIDKIPLTINRKIDTKLLPKPLFQKNQDYNVKINYSKTEKYLLDTLKELLKIESIHLTDNFYYLGGDSIIAIQLSSRLNEKGLQLNVRDILDHPELQEMSLYIQDKTIQNNQYLEEGIINHSPIIRWFISQNFDNIHYYHQSILLDINIDIDINKLSNLFQYLIEFHDTLRLNYNINDNVLFYNNEHLNKAFQVSEFNFNISNEKLIKEKILKIGLKLKSDFNIENDLLIKTALLKFNNKISKLLIVVHHLVIDGVSWRILLEDLYYLISKQLLNKPPVLVHKTTSYKDWVNYIQQNEITDSTTSILKILNTNNYNIPTDYPIDKDYYRNSITEKSVLNKDNSYYLLSQINHSYHTKPDELMIIALVLTINEIYLCDNLVIEVEGHGRDILNNQIDLSRTIGWFTSIFPVIFNLNDIQDSLSENIKLLKEQLRYYTSKNFHIGNLFQNSKSTIINIKRIRFNYLGNFDTQDFSSHFSISHWDSGNDIGEENLLTCLLDFNLYVLNSSLTISLTYSKNQFKSESIQDLLNCYLNNLNRIIIHCKNKNEVDFTPSDFETIDISKKELESFFN